jgi:hypothetical protein
LENIIMGKNDKGSNGSQALAVTSEVDIDKLGQAEALAMVRPADARSIAARVSAGELESAPILFGLEAGQEITCEVCDCGESEIEDVATRMPKRVRTWILQLFHPETGAKGPKVSILGSAQLDRQLPPFMGMTVVIARGGTTKTNKGRQLTDYFVGKVVIPGHRTATPRVIEAAASKVS